ncbi:MAG: uncharacterized protein K0S45_549 [Nitrospira sp.]|nr:uncharacterized protein [Nitrospira sp.]
MQHERQPDACVVCGEKSHHVLCSGSELREQQEFLRAFHSRRLNRGPDGTIPSSLLADRVQFSQGYLTDIVECDHCGLIFRYPRPADDQITKHYAADRYAPQRLQAIHHLQLPDSRQRARNIERLLPHASIPMVVELGSFAGSFLFAGQERGWNILGVDPGEDVSAFCRARGLRVYRGTVDDVELAPRSCDAVAIWNTFDQLPDPHPTLARIMGLLRPRGILALRIPNGVCFKLMVSLLRRPGDWRKEWVTRAMAWNNLLMFPYLYGYNRAGIDRLMAGYGLRPEAWQPDQLVTLSDHHTKTWAAWEERLIKILGAMLYRTEQIFHMNDLVTAPWLDLYYRRESSAS